jgi:AraC-like DNA-binding protein
VIRELLPAERLLFEGEHTCIGTFACDARDPFFHRERPSTAHCIVFARTAVWIRHERGPRYVADPTVVTFHNRGRAYQRWQIAEAGDRCDWIAYSDEILRDALDDRWFPHEFAPIDSRLYLRQRRLFERVAAGVADGFEAEEEAVLLLDRVSGTPPRQPLASDCRNFETIQQVRATLAAAPSAPLSVRAVAAAAGMTTFRLCRAYRRITGETMTAYRLRLRLLSSLERLRAGDAITDIALAHGFSSHSHYTAAFRTAFDVTPRMWRALVA